SAPPPSTTVLAGQLTRPADSMPRGFAMLRTAITWYFLGWTMQMTCALAVVEAPLALLTSMAQPVGGGGEGVVVARGAVGEVMPRPPAGTVPVGQKASARSCRPAPTVLAVPRTTT